MLNGLLKSSIRGVTQGPIYDQTVINPVTLRTTLSVMGGTMTNGFQPFNQPRFEIVVRATDPSVILTFEKEVTIGSSTSGRL